MTDNSFIKKFKVGDNYYVYDVIKNSFLRVNELFFALTGDCDTDDANPDKLAKYTPPQIEEEKKNIESLKKQGFLSNRRPDVTYFTYVPKDKFPGFMKERLESHLERITLIVTEDCNLRCEYCIFSGQYSFNRVHDCRKMSSETMRKAVDFYHDHSFAVSEKTVSFYGGEPFLNYSLIKETVEYAHEKFPQGVRFSMTTNAILLNEEKMKFLAENDFALLISVDGPKDIHDRYRVFDNGKGTFDYLIKKLRIFKSLYPEYYKNKIRFNTVLAPPLDLEALNEFIVETDIYPADIRFNDVNPRFTTFFDRFEPDDFKEFTTARRQALESFNMNLIKGREVSPVEKNMFSRRYYFIHRREMKELGDNAPSQGQCIIGDKSLSINVDGQFNICTQLPDSVNIGNLDDGFDVEGINKLYYELDEFLAERCKNCWAIRFCYKCLKHLNKDGKLDEGLFQEFCSIKKESISKEVQDYIKIRERNNDAFGYLEKVKIDAS